MEGQLAAENLRAVERQAKSRTRIEPRIGDYPCKVKQFVEGPGDTLKDLWLVVIRFRFLASDGLKQRYVTHPLHPRQSITHLRTGVGEEQAFFSFLPTTDALSNLHSVPLSFPS